MEHKGIKGKEQGVKQCLRGVPQGHCTYTASPSALYHSFGEAFPPSHCGETQQVPSRLTLALDIKKEEGEKAFFAPGDVAMFPALLGSDRRPGSAPGLSGARFSESGHTTGTQSPDLCPLREPRATEPVHRLPDTNT